MSFAMDEIKSRKSNNPGNLNSQAAKEAGLSYWEYMAKLYPGCVKQFVWGTKRITRKEKREMDGKTLSAMARSTNPRMRFLSQMRNLFNGRSY